LTVAAQPPRRHSRRRAAPLLLALAASLLIVAPAYAQEAIPAQETGLAVAGAEPQPPAAVEETPPGVPAPEQPAASAAPAEAPQQPVAEPAPVVHEPEAPPAEQPMETVIAAPVNAPIESSTPTETPREAPAQRPVEAPREEASLLQHDSAAEATAGSSPSQLSSPAGSGGAPPAAAALAPGPSLIDQARQFSGEPGSTFSLAPARDAASGSWRHSLACEPLALGSAGSRCAAAWIGEQQPSGSQAEVAASAAGAESAPRPQHVGTPEPPEGAASAFDNRPSGPAPSSPPGGASGVSPAGSAGGATSIFLSLGCLLLLAAPRAARRLRLSCGSWRTPFFVLIPERPG